MEQDLVDDERMRELGVTPERFHSLVERVNEDVAPQGVLPSAQVAIAVGGELAGEVTLGEAKAGDRFHIFSVTKAIVAAAAWVAIGDGLIKPSDKIADILDGFGSNDKDVITFEQLLTHTAGLPRAPLGPPDWFERQTRLERYKQWRTNWEPGSAMEYHPTSAHWVIADAIQEVSGVDYRDFIYERISVPMGLPRMRLGTTPKHPDDFSDAADVTPVGKPPTPEEFELLGLPALDLGEVTDTSVVRQNETQTQQMGQPGGGCIATAGDIAMFYQHLISDPNGIFDPEVLADGTGNVRCDIVDPMTGVPCHRSLGLIIAGDDENGRRMRGFGKMAGPRAFGHHGAGGQLAWGDPDSGVSMAFLTNGHDANMLRDAKRRNSVTNRAAAIRDPLS